MKEQSMEIGYWLSSEEHSPRDLVRNAQAAEQAGFTLAMISDHFHPWVDAQGHAPFVWSVLGALAQATTMRYGTGVTCPMIRTHPVIIAQAAATTAALMPGRFFLGVGTGENLNEHVTGAKWPPFAIRLAMLEESIEIMRLLWQGKLASHRGQYYTVENARLYTLPDTPPEIMIAAAGPEAAELAGRVGDGFINTSPEKEVVDAFLAAGGKDKPRFANMTVCWAADEASARKTAIKIWPNSSIKGALSQELPLPQHFEQAAQLVTEDTIAEAMPLGPDPAQYIEQMRAFAEAGFDHLCIHQIGADQAGFLRFFERELRPRLAEIRGRLAAD
jgi:G6PDH family F420-dependent oxidoreductase